MSTEGRPNTLPNGSPFFPLALCSGAIPAFHGNGGWYTRGGWHEHSFAIHLATDTCTATPPRHRVNFFETPVSKNKKKWRKWRRNCCVATFNAWHLEHLPPAPEFQPGAMQVLGILCALLLAVNARGWVVVSPTNVSKALLPTDRGANVAFLAGRYTSAACDWFASKRYKSLVIQGAGSPNTIIDCGGRQWLHATRFTTVSISGVTIVNASVALNTAVTHVILEDMACTRSGNCFAIMMAKTVSMAHVSVSHASSGPSVIQATGSITLSHATFQDVQSADGGGALKLKTGTKLVLTDVAIERARAKNGDGGAVLITDPYAAATVHMSNIRIDTSSASGQGGGVYIMGSSFQKVTVQDFWTFNTSAPAGGGALHVSTIQELHLSNAQMEMCQASEGECCYVM